MHGEKFTPSNKRSLPVLGCLGKLAALTGGPWDWLPSKTLARCAGLASALLLLPSSFCSLLVCPRRREQRAGQRDSAADEAANESSERASGGMHTSPFVRARATCAPAHPACLLAMCCFSRTQREYVGVRAL